MELQHLSVQHTVSGSLHPVLARVRPPLRAGKELGCRTVAAVSRSERDNLASFGEMADVLMLGVAWP